MKHLKHIICLLFLFIGISVFGQNDSIKRLMSTYANQKVAQMKDKISYMDDNSKYVETSK